MSADPTPSPAAARPGALIEFVRTERSNTAYVLLALAAAFLAGAVYLATQANKAGAPAETPAADPLNPNAPPPPAEIENPKKGDYWLGCIGLGVGCLIAAGAGATLLARVPPPGVPEQRSWTRGFVLVVGGLLGLTAFAVGFFYLVRWNEGVVAAIQAYDTGATAAARAGARWLVQLVIAMVAAVGVIFLAIQPARAEERHNQTLRRLVYGGNLVLTTVLLFAALLVLNVVFAFKVPNTLDTTETGFYTLSDATKKTVGSLAEPVTAYVILPDDNSREINDVRQLMFSAQEVSNGKFTPKFVSPVTDKAELGKLQEKYSKLDKTGTGILLAVGEGGKRHEFISANDLFKTDFQPGGGQKFQFVGEGVMVQKLRFLSDADARPVVYFTQGNGELALAGGAEGFSKAEREASQLKTHLEAYSLDVRPLEFKEGAKAEVPADAKLVVVADPLTPLSDAGAKALKDFMTRPAPDGKKGGLVVLAEARAGAKDRKMAKTGLEGLLTEFNVRLGEQFVYSVPIPQYQIGPREATVLFAGGRDGGHPIVQPFARTAAIIWNVPREAAALSAAPGGPFTVTTLMATLPDRPTWLEDEQLDSPYQALQDMAENESLRAKKRLTRSPRAVAVAVAEGGSPPNPMNPHAAAGGDQQPRLVVFANSDMFSNAAPRPRGGGTPVTHELMSASLDWLRGKPPMAPGTEKPYEMFQLPPGETLNTTRLYLLPIGLALLAIAGLGAGVWVIRRK